MDAEERERVLRTWRLGPEAVRMWIHAIEFEEACIRQEAAWAHDPLLPRRLRQRLCRHLRRGLPELRAARRRLLVNAVMLTRS